MKAVPVIENSGFIQERFEPLSHNVQSPMLGDLNTPVSPSGSSTYCMWACWIYQCWQAPWVKGSTRFTRFLCFSAARNWISHHIICQKKSLRHLSHNYLFSKRLTSFHTHFSALLWFILKRLRFWLQRSFQMPCSINLSMQRWKARVGLFQHVNLLKIVHSLP